jgi:hypothetical protein
VVVPLSLQLEGHTRFLQKVWQEYHLEVISHE